MNSVFLIGNLTTDVELREFGPEKQLATFGLAAMAASNPSTAMAAAKALRRVIRCDMGSFRQLGR